MTINDKREEFKRPNGNIRTFAIEFTKESIPLLQTLLTESGIKHRRSSRIPTLEKVCAHLTMLTDRLFCFIEAIGDYTLGYYTEKDYRRWTEENGIPIIQLEDLL